MDSSLQLTLFGELLEVLVDDTSMSSDLKKQYFNAITDSFGLELLKSILIEFQEAQIQGINTNSLISSWMGSEDNGQIIKSIISIVYCAEFTGPMGQQITGNNYIYLNAMMWKLIHTTAPSLPSGPHYTWTENPEN